MYAIGPTARIEIVRPDRATAPATAAAPIALELPNRTSVDDLHRRLGDRTGGAEPAMFPRGHYGFTVADPAGHRVLLWTEAGR